MKKQFLLLLILSILGCQFALAMQNPESIDEQLLKAVRTKNAAEVKRLIKAGAHVNYVTRQGNSVLMAACGNLGGTYDKHGASIDCHIISELLQAGANPQQINEEGYAPIVAAVDSPSRVMLLLEAGANIYHFTKDNCSPLIRAAVYHRLPALQVILDAITHLNKAEKQSIKNWLLMEQRLRNGLCQEGIEIEPAIIRLPKNIKNIIVQKITELLALDLYQRMIRAGGVIAFDKTLWYIEGAKRNNWNCDTALENRAVIQQYLDSSFLIDLVTKKIKEPTQIAQECSICMNDQKNYNESPCCKQSICLKCWHISLSQTKNTCPFCRKNANN